MQHPILAVHLSKIRLDGGTQPRVETSQDTVDEYAQAVLDGDEFPPIVLFHDGTHYWPGDGFHRTLAFQQARKKHIRAEVRDGTRRDAVLYSVSANANHGLRRTNADKRRAIETLLRDEEWVKWSNLEIARRCGVSDKTVGTVREELSPDFRRCANRRASRNGVIYTMDTTDIGREEAVIPADLVEAFNSLPREKQAEILQKAREAELARAEREKEEEQEEEGEKRAKKLDRGRHLLQTAAKLFDSLDDAGRRVCVVIRRALELAEKM